MTTLFDDLGGEPGILRLAEAWHVRCLAHPIVSHAFSHGYHPQHTERVTAYWVEVLGGPARNSQEIGTVTEVIRMHSGNGQAEEMFAAGAECFAGALTDVGLAEGPTRERLLEWWAESTERMDGYPDDAADVPEGLRVPRWEG